MFVLRLSAGRIYILAPFNFFLLCYCPNFAIALKEYLCFRPFSAVGFEMWHVELITGLVVLISSCRFLLLKTWPDFAESSEAANKQVNQVTV